GSGPRGRKFKSCHPDLQRQGFTAIRKGCRFLLGAISECTKQCAKGSSHSPDGDLGHPGPVIAALRPLVELEADARLALRGGAAMADLVPLALGRLEEAANLVAAHAVAELDVVRVERRD